MARQNELMAKPIISKPKRPEPSKWCTDKTNRHTAIAPKNAAKDTPKPPNPNANTMTTPKAAPLEVPMRLGSAKGLANKACMAAPATAKDMPTNKATNTRGQRKSQIIGSIWSGRCHSPKPTPKHNQISSALPNSHNKA